MGSKKARKVTDPATPTEVAAGSPVPEPEKKKKKKQQKGVTPTIQAPVEESAKPVNVTSEIDDIFGKKKRKKAEDDDAAKTQENSEALKLNSKGELVKKHPQVAKPKITPAAAPTVRKKTEDGFSVYSAEELGFNKKNAGGTKLCPFDCDCCF